MGAVAAGAGSGAVMRMDAPVRTGERIGWRDVRKNQSFVTESTLMLKGLLLWVLGVPGIIVIALLVFGVL